MDAIWQDLKYAARSLRKTPGFTFTAVLTLALGIGANTAIFSMLDRLFLAPPSGVVKPGELRRLYLVRPRPTARGSRDASSFFLQSQIDAIASGIGAEAVVATWAYVGFGNTLHFNDATFSIRGTIASANFLSLLGVRPALGRFYTEQEERDSARVFVISHALWRRVFNGDSSIIGRPVLLSKKLYTIVGVAQEGFTGIDPFPTEGWAPRNAPYGSPIVRLKARGDVRRLAARATLAFRRVPAPDEVWDSTQAVVTGSIIQMRGPGDLMQEVSIAASIGGVASIILLIAVANVATLLLMRAARRRREVAIRLALGISRWRLCAQFMVEGVMLAGLGGIAALLVGGWGGLVLRTSLLPWFRWEPHALDGRLFWFTLAVTLAVGVLSGLFPGIQATRPDLTQSLRAGSREGTFQPSRLRTALVIAQAALSVVLLAGAALFVRSLQKVHAIDVGYDLERLVVATASVDGDDSASRAVLAEVLQAEVDQVAAVPGVERAALALFGPMGGSVQLTVFLPGGDTIPFSRENAPTSNVVSPGFFAATGMRVVKGRDFTSADRDAPEGVVVVDESMARALWPGTSPLGKCLIVGDKAAPCRAVVGVVSDAHFSQLVGETSAHFYQPTPRRAPRWFFGTIAVRVRPDRRSAVIQVVEHDLKQQLPRSARIEVQGLEQKLGREFRPWRLGAALFSAFGLLALVVAAVGVYSVIAYTFSLRTHEMGVRVALGATSTDVFRLVVAQGLRMVSVGVVVGIIVAIAMGRLVSSLIYGISVHDPLSLAAAALVLLAAGLTATLVPARRATHVDPVEALRSE